MIRVAALAALLAVPAAARARGIDGDGNPTSERRDVPPFERVRLEGPADVSVRVGPAQAVTVTVDGNLQRLVEADVRDGTLVLRTGRRIRPTAGPSVEVTVPVLRALSVSGSGDAAVEGGAGPVALAIEGSGDLRWKGEATELRASVEGSGDVRLEGRAERLEASVEGSGDVDAVRLLARDVAASVEGSGDVDVTVDGGTLSASVSGSGDVRWRGDARVERATVSGSGEISRSR